jgi:hypothetical protein
MNTLLSQVVVEVARGQAPVPAPRWAVLVVVLEAIEQQQVLP